MIYLLFGVLCMLVAIHLWMQIRREHEDYAEKVRELEYWRSLKIGEEKEWLRKHLERLNRRKK